MTAGMAIRFREPSPEMETEPTLTRAVMSRTAGTTYAFSYNILLNFRHFQHFQLAGRKAYFTQGDTLRAGTQFCLTYVIRYGSVLNRMDQKRPSEIN